MGRCNSGHMPCSHSIPLLRAALPSYSDTSCPCIPSCGWRAAWQDGEVAEDLLRNLHDKEQAWPRPYGQALQKGQVVLERACRLGACARIRHILLLPVQEAGQQEDDSVWNTLDNSY